MCSSASASPHVSEWTQRPGGSPTQLASATSNICTYTSPTSRRTHSSKTSIRKRPYCSPVTERSGDARRPPARRAAGRATSVHGTVPSSAASATRSMIGMNWTKRAPHSSRRKRYTSRPRSAFAAWIVVSAFHSTPAVAQVLEAAHHLVERALAALVHAVGVVQLARPVDRDPDEEVVLPEERRPLLVEQRRRSSGSCRPRAARAAGTGRRARPSGGRTRGPSASARRPARRSSPRARCACASISCRM